MSGRRPTKRDDLENFLYRYRRDLAQARDYVLTLELSRTEWKGTIGAALWKRLREQQHLVLIELDKLVGVVADAQP